MDRNRVHHARATSNLEALFPTLCHFTFKKALEYEISCFCGMIYARQWCVGYWGGGGRGALVVLQSNLVIKQNILSNVSKCMQKQEEEKKNKQTNSNYTHQ